MFVRIAITAVLAFSVAATSTAAAADYFWNLYHFPVSGRVGYHMVSGAKAAKEVEPPNCAWGFESAEIQGDLPPGLTFDSKTGRIEGTPRQPGVWVLTTTYHNVQCTNTGQAYGDRSDRDEFHIEP